MSVEPCEHDTLGCGDRTPHEEHTKVGDGRPCCGWPPACRDEPAAEGLPPGLAVCDMEHGHDGNPARVYGHHGSPRTCIRIKATNAWVYDPAWERSERVPLMPVDPPPPPYQPYA